MKRLKNKLISKKGDTLIESMVAFTIVCIAMVLLADVIVSSTSSLKTAKEGNEAYQSISQRYWNGEGTKSSQFTTLNFGGFKMDVNLDSYTVDNATFYEFSKVESNDEVKE